MVNKSTADDNRRPLYATAAGIILVMQGVLSLLFAILMLWEGKGVIRALQGPPEMVYLLWLVAFGFAIWILYLGIQFFRQQPAARNHALITETIVLVLAGINIATGNMQAVFALSISIFIIACLMHPTVKAWINT